MNFVIITFPDISVASKKDFSDEVNELQNGGISFPDGLQNFLDRRHFENFYGLSTPTPPLPRSDAPVPGTMMLSSCCIQ